MLNAELIGMELHIMLGNLNRSIRAAVIDENVFPVSIALTEHALYAFCEIVLGVVKGCNYTDERRFGVHEIWYVNR
jgi:hypothetical protein